jgi:hypothetical protein
LIEVAARGCGGTAGVYLALADGSVHVLKTLPGAAQLELELLVDGKDPKHLDPKWKKQLKKSIQTSLENVKDRVEEMPLSAEMLKQQNKKRRQEKERVDKEAGGGKSGATTEAAGSGGKDGAANTDKKKAKKDKKK